MKAPRAKQLTLAGKVAPPFCCSTIRIVSRHTFKTAVSLASSPAASVLGVGPQRLLIDKACLPCPSGACWWTTTTATRTICSRRDAGAATSPAAGARQPLALPDVPSSPLQLLSVVGGGRVDVVRNDAVSWEDLRPRIEAGDWHCVVLSPGPGTPDRCVQPLPAPAAAWSAPAWPASPPSRSPSRSASDVGVCVDVLRHVASVPVLGVCLGHQALAAAHGARVVRAPEPVHGRLSLLEHAGHPLFAGVPPSSPVVRYHSLVVDAATLPAELTAIAHCTRETYAPRADPAGRAGADPGERLVMALAHRTRPHVGVQFHPESVLTSHGCAAHANSGRRDWVTAWHMTGAPRMLPRRPRMVENFLRMAAAFWGGATVPALLGVPAAAGAMVHRSALEEEWAQAGCRGAFGGGGDHARAVACARMLC